ncbi:MAG: hypothetical protein U9R65_00430 [Pseudomonadota bacterium]|nr:hypothetical protein [Pseudomonadota bacterium]
MKTKEERLEELNKILASNNLGFAYDILNDRENGLVLPFFARYMDAVNIKGLEFIVTTDTNATAGILYKHNLIFLSYGLFDRLCKLSLLIHASGVLDGKKKPFNFFDLHLVDNPFTGFSNESDEFGEAPEVYLLLFIFDSLLGFIVAHEVGHFVNNHGYRINFSDDVIGHKRIAREQLIQSHARELVADNYAFKLLRNDIEQAILTNNPVVGNLSEEYKNGNGASILSLLFMASYFKLMDGQNPNSHFESTHPEAVIRVKFLFSCYLEPYIDTEFEEKMAALLIVTIRLLKEVYEYKGDSFEVDWKHSPEINQWYLEIHSELPKWSIQST